jgi:hypothetical protein
MRRRCSLLLALVCGCGPRSATPGGETSGGDDGDSVGAPDGGTFPPSTTSTSTTATADSTSGAGSDSSGGSSGGFISFGDLVVCGQLPGGTKAHCTRCDLWAQDCPRGEKCSAWANDGQGIYNATICVELPRTPIPVGGACTTELVPASGRDECELGSICLHHDDDGIGECVPFCEGSAEAPQCADDLHCAIELQGVLPLCVAACDPLVDDCALGQCAATDDSFSCFPVLPPPSALGEACELQTQCPPASACVNAGSVPACDGFACCTPLCDLSVPMPDAACPVGTSCITWWESGTPAPGLEHVGVCML